MLRAHLTRITEAFEAACTAHRGLPLCDMITAAASAFFDAKMIEPRVALALYSVSSDVDGLGITEDLRLRNESAFEQLLLSAPEKLRVDSSLAAFTMQSTMIGISRRILSRKSQPVNMRPCANRWSQCSAPTPKV